MAHVGGSLQAQFMARVRGQDLSRRLVVPVDVGKDSALALVADHYGEVVVQPFDFPLNEPGFGSLVSAIARAEGAREATLVRVGVESAGHYHRNLVARLRTAVAAVAVGHRAHRLAFAMLRSQQPYDPAAWAKSVAAGRTAMAKTARARQNDVTCPPPVPSLTQGGEADKDALR